MAGTDAETCARAFDGASLRSWLQLVRIERLYTAAKEDQGTILHHFQTIGLD